MRNLKLAAALAGAITIAGVGFAIGQAISTGNEFATQTPGKTVIGVVQMIWNASLGYAQPVSTAVPFPISAGPYQYKWLGDTKAATSIASVTALSGLAPAGTTYVVLQPINGTAYITNDGSTPSSTNYDVTLAALQPYPISGADTISRMKIVGTNLAANYWQ